MPDEAYFDGRIAAEAVKALREVKDRPFFLAVGFWKPHLPFNPPKKYWDLYDRDEVSLPVNPDHPEDVPEIALHNGQELLGKKGEPLTDEEVCELRHGYYAGVSFLDGANRQGARRAGSAWTDRSNGRRLLVRPWVPFGRARLVVQDLEFRIGRSGADDHCDAKVGTSRRDGKRTRRTARRLSNRGRLVRPHETGRSGRVSLVPILKDPGATVKTGACTQHPRPAYYKDKPKAMGCSVRTLTHRYTEWRDYATGKIVARELYDHRSDPRETKNMAGQPGQQDDVERMSQELRKVFPQKP